MADDFRDDPDYKKARGGMFGSRVKSFIWGAGAVLLASAAASAVSTIGIIALAAGALFAGYKAWSHHTDEKAALAEVAAQRTAHHINKNTQTQNVPTIEQDQGTPDTRWQKSVDARRVESKTQTQGAQH